MARFKFVGPVETVLHGLTHGVNATLHRKGHGQPDGSTVVAQPGDLLDIKGDYPHALLEPAPAPAKKTPAKKAAPKPADQPALASAPAPAPTTGSEE